MMAFFFACVLRCDDGSFYIGATVELQQRMGQHERESVESTARRLPAALVYYEACLTEKGAFAREKQLMTGYGRRCLISRIRAN